MFAIHEQNVLAQNLSFHSKTSVYAYDPLGHMHKQLANAFTCISER
jgi:hypothetical protein